MTTEQYRLYKLIWERFVASQMASAVFIDTVDRGYCGKRLHVQGNGFRTLVKRALRFFYNYSEDEEGNRHTAES